LAWHRLPEEWHHLLGEEHHRLRAEWYRLGWEYCLRAESRFLNHRGRVGQGQG
jgi:hypothetical protein